MLNELTVAQALGTVSKPVKHLTARSGIRGMVVWERNNSGPVDYCAPNHHTLSVYLGGGTGTWSCESRAWGFSDAICLLPEGHDSRWRHTGHVKTLHLYFTDEDLASMNWATSADQSPVIYGRQPVLSQLSATLANSLDWSDPTCQLAVDHIVLAMLSQFSQAEISTARKLSPSTLEKIEARLRELESGVPSLAELAADAGMSPRHLTRLYKLTTHLTLSQRQRQIQVERAKQELIRPTKLSAIALTCGFSSQSHFTTVFRSITGITPLQWRNLQR